MKFSFSNFFAIASILIWATAWAATERTEKSVSSENAFAFVAKVEASPLASNASLRGTVKQQAKAPAHKRLQ